MKKRFFCFIFALFLLIPGAFFRVSAVPSLLDDSEGLLTADESAALAERLAIIRSVHSYDLVIHTTSSFRGKDAVEYADDYFDDGGYGCGADYDGSVLVLSWAQREMYVSSSGVGIYLFNEENLDPLFDLFTDALSEGRYAEALSLYVDGCEDRLNRREEYISYYEDPDNGDPAYPTRARSFFHPGILIFSLLLGIVAACIAVSVMKGKLKSVRSKRDANSYLVKNSLKVTGSNDHFLYSNVTKVRIDTDSDRGGSRGGGHRPPVHVSSSGHSHGGGGRHF